MPALTFRRLACLLLLAAGGHHALAADRGPLSPPGFGRAIATHGDLVFVGAPYVNDGVGQAYLFRREGGSHRLQGVIKRPVQWGESRFGRDVALDQKTLVVGASGVSFGLARGAGMVYLFPAPKAGEPVDEPQRLFPPQPERWAGFGDSVALHGDLLAVGESARYDGGRVLLYRRDKDQWTRESILNATQLERDSMIAASFGEGVAMNGTTLAVGAPYTEFHEVTKGAVFVYDKNDEGRFDEPPTMLAWKDRQAHEFFGNDVALGEDFIVVSALLAVIDGHEDAGAACVYVRGADGRFPAEPTTVLTAAKPQKGEGFASTLAVFERRILVGTSRPTDGESGVYVFEPTAGDESKWTQVAHLTGMEPAADFGGTGLAATESLIYVGEAYPQPYGTHNGQVAVLAREENDGRVTFRRIETIQMPE